MSTEQQFIKCLKENRVSDAMGVIKEHLDTKRDEIKETSKHYVAETIYGMVSEKDGTGRKKLYDEMNHHKEKYDEMKKKYDEEGGDKNYEAMKHHKDMYDEKKKQYDESGDGSKKTESLCMNEQEDEIPQAMVDQYEQKARAERQNGGHVQINWRLPSVSVVTSTGEEYHFQEHEADDLLDRVPANISAEDFILAQSVEW